MDGLRFDRVARLLAGKSNRRQVVAALLGVGTTAAISTGASARPRCRGEGLTCTKDSDCCSGSCERLGGIGRHVCVAAPEPKCDTFVCGDLCCPAEAVGCAPLDVPGGSVFCQCPKGQELVDGQCKPIECSDRSNCAGPIRCGNASNVDLCCPHPLKAFCSCESPNTGGEEVGCCMPGVDCPEDLGWDNHEYLTSPYYGPCVEDGVVICCCEGEDCDYFLSETWIACHRS
jgi:hypothetical protein